MKNVKCKYCGIDTSNIKKKICAACFVKKSCITFDDIYIEMIKEKCLENSDFKNKLICILQKTRGI